MRAAARHARLAVLACAAALAAQGPADVGAPQRRTCRIGRVAEADAPVVDAKLDDPCWATAPAIGDLVMIEPYEGRPPTQPTVVKALHDRHNLYLALWCFDDDPSSIRATKRERDAELDPDDRVEILFDTFENRRTGYFFQVGAGGSIGDGLTSQNGSRFDKPWDVLFDGTARITDRGWQAELVIPFRSIPRKRGAVSWGFNVHRIKRSTGEESQWANATQSVPFFRVSELGTLTGFGEIDEGIGLDVVPYAAVSWKRDRTAPDRGFDFEPKGGGDAFYRITPELTLALTAFTDFAETEVDSRQISLDRFPLFFPEKRDFFLEGAGYFAFGPGGEDTPDVLPFFSRRIGLDPSGAIIPVLAGVKLTGEAGPLEVGMLGVETDPPGGHVPDDLAVVRLRYSLAEQTTVGMIATTGNPAGTGHADTAGVDLYHRVPHLVGDLDLQLFASVLGTQRDGDGGDGHDVDVEAQSRGREWRLGLGARWTSAEFEPALGFVRRTGVAQYTFTPSWSPRFVDDDTWRNLAFEGLLRWVRGYESDFDGTEELAAGLEFAGIESHQGDRLGVTATRRFERVPQDFTLFGDTVTIAAGEYWTTRGGVVLESSDGRDLSGSGTVTTGDFFDGRSTEIELATTLRASAALHVGLSWQSAIVELGPGRDFTTQIGEARLDLFPSTWVSLHNLLQFDNESEELGWQSRLRWIRSPGNDFFAVVGAAWERTADGSLLPTRQELTFKLQQTLRF